MLRAAATATAASYGPISTILVDNLGLAYSCIPALFEDLDACPGRQCLRAGDHSFGAVYDASATAKVNEFGRAIWVDCVWHSDDFCSVSVSTNGL